MSERIDIGLLEKKEEWLLHPRFFPSKVGGAPAWLDLADLPPPSDLQCDRCQEPMVFLCQVYAPYEEKEECFHRTIFIFICRNPNCCRPNSSDNFAVLRSQLSRNNTYYPNEPSEEKNENTFCIKKWVKLCAVCGAKAPSHCSKCKNAYYCSRNHQVFDWQKGHKQKCGSQIESRGMNMEFAPTDIGKSILFEEWELLIEEEDKEDVIEVNVESEMEKMQKLLKEKSMPLNNISDSEMEQYASSIPEDKIFNKFNKRVSRHPDQVLRYDRGGLPLFITNIKTEQLEIPKCPYCDDDRQFEFQVMPQLLNYINVGLDFNSIDWGILAVYTCKNSCSEGPAYKKEHLIKQDLTTEK